MAAGRRPPSRRRPSPRRRAPPPSRRPARRPLAARCAFLSFLIPGAGQLYAGRRRRGIVMLSVSAGALVYLLLRMRGLESRSGLAATAVDTRFLLGLLAVDLALLAFRLFAIGDAFRLGRAPQAAGATLGVLALFAILPHAAVAYYAYQSYDTIESVFASEEPTDVLQPVELASNGADGPVTYLPVVASNGVRINNANELVPEEAGPPWKQRGRLNVLLLGADAGPGRGGLRTDTMIVATIATKTRQTALFSVPRNLIQVPLPQGGQLFAQPLNGLYEWAVAHPEAFAGAKSPGPTALKQTIGQLVGLPIDYYVMVDFRGFYDLVAAFGGVDLNVPQAVLDRVSPYQDGGDWVRIDLKPGRQHLDADQAFAYVRARTQTSDYSRIARQRCVIASLASRATPAKLLGSFSDLAATLRQNVSTDIPAKTLPSLAELAAGVQLDRVTSLGFVPPQFERARDPSGYSIPDVAKIRAAVAQVIAGGTATTGAQAGAASGSACA